MASICTSLVAEPCNKKPRLTKAEMLARARKPLWRVSLSNSTVNQEPVMASKQQASSRTSTRLDPVLPEHSHSLIPIDPPSLPPSLKSILNSTFETCSSMMVQELEGVHFERRKLQRENRSLHLECAQAKHERDTAFTELQNLTGELHRGYKRKNCDDEPRIRDDAEYFNFVKPAGPGIYHPSQPAGAIPGRQLSPPLPKLQLSHVQAMYGQFNDKVYCRVCLMRNSGHKTRPPTSFLASHLSLDDLVFHCVFEHPMTYSDVTGLTVDQVKEVQNRLSPLMH